MVAGLGWQQNQLKGAESNRARTSFCRRGLQPRGVLRGSMMHAISSGHDLKIKMRCSDILQRKSHFKPLRAVASPEAVSNITEKSFPLRNSAQIQMTVETSESGGQTIRAVTNLQAGRLLLHWGVEGGKDYKGGWRLPGSQHRPEGTVQYKDRALQTPWKTRADGSMELTIVLNGDEASDCLNFVLKDDATNTWYDNNGGNFTLNLRGGDSSATVTSATASSAATNFPKDLCDKWAWVRWDAKGRPSRSEAGAGQDYDAGVVEMKELLARGKRMEELWQVVNGGIKYEEYVSKHLGIQVSKPKPDVKPAQVAVTTIPEDLLAVQAYVLWEKAGKPDGADFSGDARRVISEAVQGGVSFEELAARLNHTPKWHSNGSATAAAPAASAAAVTAPPAKVQPQSAKIGQPLGGVRNRNPLDLIKRRPAVESAQGGAPVLSAEKSEAPAEKPLDYLVQRFAVDSATKWRRTYAVGGKSELLAVVRQESETMPVRVDLITDMASEVLLHWAITKPGSRDWQLPPEELWPDRTRVAGKTATDTEMLNCDDDECDVEILGAKVPLQRVTIYLPPDHTVAGITFVLRSSDGTMWYKDAGGNFFVPVPGKLAPDLKMPVDPISAMPDELCNAWTLMHRFNKATDLLFEVLNGYFEVDMATAMAELYCWLRYSAIRQLTWQRNYNTQPRILSAAQERLTNSIAQTHGRTTGEAQEWVRMMLTTVGRGGDGQRIRDEILHIMHRNHIPEKKGLWMEEWHQKLHNNTTPDDVPICEAYLAFLESNGNREAYWRVLSDAGVTRQRLEGFDRPITLEPEFYGDKKGALISEFRNYLGILKAVHSGADLQASATAAGNRIPDSARGFLGYVLSHLGDSQILPLMEAAVEARAELASVMTGNRELLYLDLALEDQVRQAAERGVASAGFGAAAFMKPLLQNLCLSLGDNEELCYCLKTWQELPPSVRNGGRPNKEEALQAVAVINRIRRAIAEVSDRVVNRIGNVSRLMGEAFGAEDWASSLFAEEVVRGGPAFAVSLVLSSVEPVLRNSAALGAWQVISPTPATGVIEVVEGLHLVQDKTYEVPTVLVAHQVTGEEEIPEGVVAVLTPDAPDVLSHVSVRARNMKVLFATCHDPEPLNQIKAMVGKTLSFTTTASGAVSWSEGKASDLANEKEKHSAERKGRGLKIEVPTWCGKWVVPMDAYEHGVVGAKSRNLAGLRGKLPEHIKLPSSVTLPFGCFEEVLDQPENSKIKKQLVELVAALNKKSKTTLLESIASMMSMDEDHLHASSSRQINAAEVLSECRKLAMQVHVPMNIREELTKAMQAAGVPVPESEERWGMALDALKGVWASKYNDRAYYSLRKVDLNFDDVRMAVLVQRVVPAQYAFVIHTKNPSNNDEEEVFCEMVRGLGESLVSGMIPGSAIAFKANKQRLDAPEVLCYASKSEGMFVRESLIFRSDSNGEDLEGYAGAGLYESITMDITETLKIDYMDDKLVQDVGFRKHILSEICKVGYAIEQALGGVPQDIEGVVAPDGTITVVQTRPQV
ncbi:hypothetical protein CEUSTIGMA_g5772.t1 [Chlamydomonas eustigma]|uniref:Uncharacterized protein n=1 Tax=Chlamydomonas eustigma TaxID=1157962 RepID=A0A250X6D3_9CHLO|nr:hypothetical protein CEUSTIGMA_g5772.t1 [Chlamydomonas eustigma]|eukprot:GAX78330.1 hypothetical protein CEUSTIGMA_g5772.t1 [Chlamydomonas eustigma]